MPRLEQSEIKKYWQLFGGLKPQGNKLARDRLLGTVFKNSHLPQDTLEQIWTLADIDEDGSLDFEEFCIAMRLLYDMVNHKIDSVPSELPPWLIPGSKAEILKRKGQGGSQAPASGDSSDDDADGFSLSDDFDWYISPTDRSTYETVYNSSCDSLGRIRFDALRGLYGTLKGVPETDISSAWNLVNPKQSETIDKDQCMVFLHMLNQRTHGRRIPRSVPASLRATFSKETPEYSVDSKQGEIHEDASAATSGGFGSNYLSQMGVNSRTQGAAEDLNESHDKDWEEVRLQRQLRELEEKLERAQGSGVVKYEYEQLLKYKESQVAEIGKHTGLQAVSNNGRGVEAQLEQLRGYLASEKEELGRLRSNV